MHADIIIRTIKILLKHYQFSENGEKIIKTIKNANLNCYANRRKRIFKIEAKARKMGS